MRCTSRDQPLTLSSLPPTPISLVSDNLKRRARYLNRALRLPALHHLFIPPAARAAASICRRAPQVWAKKGEKHQEWPTRRRQPIGFLVLARRIVLDVQRHAPVSVELQIRQRPRTERSTYCVAGRSVRSVPSLVPEATPKRGPFDPRWLRHRRTPGAAGWKCRACGTAQRFCCRKRAASSGAGSWSLRSRNESNLPSPPRCARNRVAPLECRKPPGTGDCAAGLLLRAPGSARKWKRSSHCLRL